MRYDGGAFDPAQLLQHWRAQGRIIALCPEVAGGLPTPRPAAEILGGQGAAVLDGLVPVVTVSGQDVTGAFLSGATAALRLVAEHDVRYAVLKARSPSCGNHATYDGSFRGIRVAGEGVTAAALRRHGVQVFNETELAQLAALLATAPEE